MLELVKAWIIHHKNKTCEAQTRITSSDKENSSQLTADISGPFHS